VSRAEFRAGKTANEENLHAALDKEGKLLGKDSFFYSRMNSTLGLDRRETWSSRSCLHYIRFKTDDSQAI